jgi:Homing endonuclease associated repeat/Homeodomain-like domain
MTPREQAAELRAQGWGYKRVGRALDVSPTTIRRWLKPGFVEHNRQLSREAKQRRTGHCATPGCENLTRYAGHERPLSEYCYECHMRRTADRRRAEAFTATDLIAMLLARRAELGRNPRSSDFFHGTPAHSCFYRVFGSWPAALEAAGLPLNRARNGSRKVAA